MSEFVLHNPVRKVIFKQYKKMYKDPRQALARKGRVKVIVNVDVESSIYDTG